ncbi:MAG TPA: PQQ-binding-like beta-propeller repeat protein, partial [Polyangiales bacterium]|nr:PQQ-binding-like beta-propeller repeat protein [Polyangiales bacterium]
GAGGARSAEAAGAAGAAGLAGTAAAGMGGAGSSAPAEVRNEWLMMGYDQRSWYFNPNEKTLSVSNASQLVEKWRFSAGIPNGTAIVAEGKVFVMAGINQVGGTYALDLETGKQIWRRPDIAGSASVAYDAGFVYVQNSLPPTMYKLKASDGSTVWGPVEMYDAEVNSGESSPIIAKGKVLVGHENGLREISYDTAVSGKARGAVEALDMETGKKVWTYFTVPETGEDGASVWSSVTVDLMTDVVYATTGNNFTVDGPNGEAFHAFELATGKRLWVKKPGPGSLSFQVTGDDNEDTDFGANPILAEIDGRRIVAAGNKAGAFYALDRDTGEVLWSREQLSPTHGATFGGVLMNGAFDGRYFYVVSNDAASGGARLHKLDPTKKGESVWVKTLNAITWGSPSLANGLLVVPNDSMLYVMNAETGDILTKFETGGTMAGGAAAIVQGKIIVKSGLLYTASKANDQIICYALPGGGTAPQAGTGAAGSGSEPARTPSFSAIYRDIITAGGCTSGSCHGGPAGGLNMRSKELAYMNLVGVEAMGISNPSGAPNCADSGLLRVAPRDPDKSLLVHKLEHTQSCGAPMPSESTKLPADQLQQLRSWISKGAPND